MPLPFHRDAYHMRTEGPLGYQHQFHDQAARAMRGWTE